MPGAIPLVVENSARRRLANFTRDERRQIRRLLGLIQLNPWIDNIHKIIVPRPPLIQYAYVDRDYWIYYYVRGNLILVTNIVRATAYEPIPW